MGIEPSLSTLNPTTFLSEHRPFGSTQDDSGGKIREVTVLVSVPSDPAFYGVDLQTIACWEYGFKSRRGQGCLSLETIVCC